MIIYLKDFHGDTNLFQNSYCHDTVQITTDILDIENIRDSNKMIISKQNLIGFSQGDEVEAYCFIFKYENDRAKYQDEEKGIDKVQNEIDYLNLVLSDLHTWLYLEDEDGKIVEENKELIETFNIQKGEYDLSDFLEYLTTEHYIQMGDLDCETAIELMQYWIYEDVECVCFMLNDLSKTYMDTENLIDGFDYTVYQLDSGKTVFIEKD